MKIKPITEWDASYLEELLEQLDNLPDNEVIEVAMGILLIGYESPGQC